MGEEGKHRETNGKRKRKGERGWGERGWEG